MIAQPTSAWGRELHCGFPKGRQLAASLVLVKNKKIAKNCEDDGKMVHKKTFEYVFLLDSEKNWYYNVNNIKSTKDKE